MHLELVDLNILATELVEELKPRAQAVSVEPDFEASAGGWV